MNKLFESRPFLIELIRRCDQATLRVLLKPICKQLIHPDVMREIARNLELSGMETIKCHQQKPRWKYGEFLNINIKEVKLLEEILTCGYSKLWKMCLTDIEIIQRVNQQELTEHILTNPKNYYLIKVTEKISSKFTGHSGFISSIKNADGIEMIQCVIKENVWFTKSESKSMREYLGNNFGHEFEIIHWCDKFDLEKLPDTITTYFGSDHDMILELCDNQPLYITRYVTYERLGGLMCQQIYYDHPI